ncbi:hypothetical protein JCM33374_g4409 [Metschnikowia sp. JCM 33374]|nr:hypothetical protein JCM33374_g4409 [Metschnikowia sp. JCM 33374]
MAEPHSYTQQPKSTPSHFPTVSGVIPPASNEQGTFQYPHFIVNNGEFLSSYEPIHVYYAQAGYQTSETDSYDYLRAQKIAQGASVGTIPPIDQFIASIPNYDVTRSSVAGHSGPFLSESRKTCLHKFYPQAPRLNYSITPMVPSVTHRLTTLPYDISKSNIKESIQTSLPNFSFPVPNSQVIPVPPNTYIPIPHPPTPNTSFPQSSEKFKTLESCTEDSRSSDSKVSQKKCKVRPDVKESFAVPVLSTKKSKQLAEVLVDKLRQCPTHVSLDEFFKLLYDERLFFDSILKTQGPNDVVFGPTGMKSEEVELLYLVLNRFSTPKKAMEFMPGMTLKRSQSSTAKLNELLQTFLAIKIIFSTVRKVDKTYLGTVSVSGIAVYKMYYITCQKLFRKHPALSEPEESQNNRILGHSRLGKITKLVYPNTMTKRLGRRGNSKAHYIGLTLNYSIIDPDTRSLLQLDIQQLKDHFTQNQKFEDRRQNSTETAQGKLSPAAVNVAGISPFSYNTQPFQTHLPHFVDSWAATPDHGLFAQPMNQNPSPVTEHSMGPSLIWTAPLKPCRQ